SQAQMACPIKFSAGLSAPRHIGAALGADTVAVLEGLGYSAERIAELKAAGAIA
ncbi:CoA transferase, partial [Pseudomonas aeruginosa]|nr:CoA transferase [Pseudomonas aeruginosa]